jgi:hypothetical protein
MKKKLLTILTVLSTLTVFGQSTATTDDGKKVKLNPNGTWEYVEEETTTYRPTSSVFMGGKKLIAGERTVVHSEEYGLTTSISIAKDGEKTLIIFWQESEDKDMNFFNWLWTGTVMLYLESGETISLTDRNMKGQNKITNGHTSSYGSKSDLYQRFSAYYLTPSECIKLKKSNLSQVAYKTTSNFEGGTTYVRRQNNLNFSLVSVFCNSNLPNLC